MGELWFGVIRKLSGRLFDDWKCESVDMKGVGGVEWGFCDLQLGFWEMGHRMLGGDDGHCNRSLL